MYDLKWEYGKVTIYAVMEAVFAIGSIWFLEKAVSAIELWDWTLFKNYILSYWLAIILFYPIMYLSRINRYMKNYCYIR